MKFIDRLAKANPGDEIMYHQGYCCLNMFGDKVPEAKEAWEAYERGDVLLYQRRLGVGVLAYCAKVIR